ncbi:SDR family oxidoreductase [Uniformispora flossi]|uniref:SDR family oxidoreductase n=1 Tax=Uniformispora flossi TaxID=3390723 RepID=UPI003C2E2EA5
MTGRLEGQTALIVGAAGGLGAAVTRRYLAEGCAVVAADRDPERVAALAASAGDHPRLRAVTADAATWEGSRELAAEVRDTFGGPDVFVSCVGVYDHGARLADIDGAELGAALDECYRANVGSVLLNLRAVLEPLAARRGRVVLTASYASYRAGGGGVLYTSAKHAVRGLVTQLAYELAPAVRVNAVAPGVLPTVMSGLGALGQQARDAVLPGTEDALPLHRVPTPDDMAGLYVMLADPADTVAVTGTTIVADSGLLSRGLGTPAGGDDLWAATEGGDQ